MDNQQENQTTPHKGDAALREERILAFWKEQNVFEKSLQKDSPKGNYVFYDGPPFATGQMHYGHILGSTAKDAIGRYQTMRGFHVPRRWGWDCHGLPIENIVEKELGIAGHKEIESLGIEKFVEYARSKVLEYDTDWEKGVERIGRWVDFKGGYKTMDNTFIESVWWALSEFDRKGLIYEGVRVLAYCPRCETPIANSEIAMDNSYKDITDISVYVKFELIDEPHTYLLAWTTTPWTLPGNFALAINPTFNYVKIKIGENFYILAKERLIVVKEPYEIIAENISLIGKSYTPLFDYFIHSEMPNKQNAWKVYAADYVTHDAGTGIVHISPGYGEEDMELAKRENIPYIHHVLNNGHFSPLVTDFVGLPVKPKSEEKDGQQVTDIEIIKYLAGKGLLFAKEKIVHAYPHCMRCETPIIYYALPSWFVAIQKVKADLQKSAEEMQWVPEHLKEGRFKNILESAPDWTISRNRYWASPLPIWKCKECDKRLFIGSLEQLKERAKRSFNTYSVMRHGQSQGNIDERVSSLLTALDPLTESGKQQVRTAAEKLLGTVDLIIASPVMRTKMTAEIVHEILKLPTEALIFDERLREIEAGEFEGKQWTEYHDFVYGMGRNKWFSEPIPGGESLESVRTRVGSMLYELEEKYKNKKILIVTHGGPAWLLFVAAGQFLPDNKPYHCYAEDSTCAFVSEFKKFDNAEVRQLPFIPLPHTRTYGLDLHRPYIDAVKLLCDCGELTERIPEVIDCWFESGSMPFAQDHYPFERPAWRQENFPAGFVAEYIAQTRTWFYYSLAVSGILFGHAPFRHIVTTGTLRAEDGQKISKSKKNYPDPWIFIDKYGVDPLRLYLMNGPLMKGEDANFSEKTVSEIASKIIGRLYNVLTFYELYRDASVEQDIHSINFGHKSNNILDIWIVSRLAQLLEEITHSMEVYDMADATRPLDAFIDDLSTWYVRRSRERLKNGDVDAKRTLYRVLKVLAQILAPFTPFTAEDIWQKLKVDADPLSVHLTSWPDNVQTEILLQERSVIADMAIARTYVTLGLEARQKANIKVRQPLTQISIRDWSLDEVYKEIIIDELNVKTLTHDKVLTEEVFLDLHITPELKIEGMAREFMRTVQDLRKKISLVPSDSITLTVVSDEIGFAMLNTFSEMIKQTVGATSLIIAENDGEVQDIEGHQFKITIHKV